MGQEAGRAGTFSLWDAHSYSHSDMVEFSSGRIYSCSHSHLARSAPSCSQVRSETVTRSFVDVSTLSPGVGYSRRRPPHQQKRGINCVYSLHHVSSVRDIPYPLETTRRSTSCNKKFQLESSDSLMRSRVQGPPLHGVIRMTRAIKPHDHVAMGSRGNEKSFTKSPRPRENVRMIRENNSAIFALLVRAKNTNNIP